MKRVSLSDVVYDVWKQVSRQKANAVEYDVRIKVRDGLRYFALGDIGATVSNELGAPEEDWRRNPW